MTAAGSAEERVGRLYSIPLAEFTVARNALAKELRKEGDREAAETVKGLKKPSTEGWAVNQLVREHGDEVGRLIELGEEQAEVLGSGDRDRVRKAMDDVKGTLSSLTDHAERVLRGTDRRPTPALLDRITRMLQTAAATDEGRAALRAGRFTGELAADDLPEVELAAAAPRRASDDAKPERAERVDEADREGAKQQPRENAKQRAAARAELEKLERALRRAEERAQLLADRAADVEARAREARAHADEALASAADARAALETHRHGSSESARSLREG